MHVPGFNVFIGRSDLPSSRSFLTLNIRRLAIYIAKVGWSKENADGGKTSHVCIFWHQMCSAGATNSIRAARITMLMLEIVHLELRAIKSSVYIQVSLL